MDIIDIMLAKAMTPQGQTETYVSIANAAAAKAEKAESDAEAAIAVVTNAAEDITAAQEAAATLLETAETVAAAYEGVTSSEDLLAGKADKTDTILNTTLSRDRKENTTVGEGSFAFGIHAEASGDYSHAEGASNIASGYSSHAEGTWSTASGQYSHAEGSGGTTASGSGAHAEGCGTTASNFAAHAEGVGTTASGTMSHAEGSGVVASGSMAHAEGASTTASGTLSHAEGGGTTASGLQSHAEGSATTASGIQSHAEGIGTTASGAQSHTEGVSTVASGAQSHAEGAGTTASGQQSHVEGVSTQAIGFAEHVSGFFNVPDTALEWIASTPYAVDDLVSRVETFTDGGGVSRTRTVIYKCKTANSDSSFVSSKWKEWGQYLESIGNGTADDARSNARTLDWSGNEHLAGDLTVFTGTNNEISISSLKTAINNISTNGGNATISFNVDDAGYITVVGEDGSLTASSVTEEELIEALLQTGTFPARDAVGIEIDYDNKTIRRTQQAVGKSMGSDFNSFLMYGGRRRCNVADDGTINAFYGESGYKEDGSNGQVMIYQPKFYYRRVPIIVDANKVGKTIVRDSLMVSYSAQSSFKPHPLFRDNNGEELDYVLLSAYEGGLYDVSQGAYFGTTAVGVDFNNDKMTSVVNTKPITGSSGLTLQRAEQLANNRGTGWHIFNIEAESASQMLEVIEFGSLNGQSVLGSGICNLGLGENNIAAITGATTLLGNTSGVAASTTLEVNGSTSTTTDSDKSAISYRGLENPWGNVWQMLGGILVYGNTTSNGGIPYICKDYNYSYTQLTNNYESAGFSLPNNSGWISALGYGEKSYDWLLMPSAANNANSILPIGDNGWFDSNLNGLRMVVHGGGWSFEESDGPFYYGCDKQPTDSTYKSYGARLLFIPTKNEIYTANISKWQQEMNIGG